MAWLWLGFWKVGWLYSSFVEREERCGNWSRGLNIVDGGVCWISFFWRAYRLSIIDSGLSGYQLIDNRP